MESIARRERRCRRGAEHRAFLYDEDEGLEEVLVLVSNGEPRFAADLREAYPGSAPRFPENPRYFAKFPETCGQRSAPPEAVFFDRDGTLVRDVPYNCDPERVDPMPYAREALDLLRASGIRVGVVTNQSGIGRGRFGAEDVRRVHARVEELLGPFDSWQVCPHTDADRCACRKPAPGLVTAAAAELGLAPERCAVIGDIGSDVAAAAAAGARSVLVPTPVTRDEEISGAPMTAPHLLRAVELLLGVAS